MTNRFIYLQAVVKMLLTNIYHVIFDAIDSISVIDGIDGISSVIDGRGTLGRITLKLQHQQGNRGLVL